MSKKKDNFKLYGSDLEKELNETQLKLRNLQQKILKRAKLLQKLEPDMIIRGGIASECDIKGFSVTRQLEFIQEIERIYVNRSEQLYLFNQKNEKK